MRAFAVWTLVAAVTSFGVFTAPSIGVFVIPVGVLAVVVALRTAERGSALWGVAAGVGVASFTVGLLQIGGSACDNPAGAEVVACGGDDSPLPWLVAGCGLAATSLLGRRFGRGGGGRARRPAARP